MRPEDFTPTCRTVVFVVGGMRSPICYLLTWGDAAVFGAQWDMLLLGSDIVRAYYGQV